MKRNTIGILNGVIASLSYGTNPLFAIPLLNRGFEVSSILFYRYAIAVLLYGLWIKFVQKISLKISKKEFFVLFCLGLLFSFSSLALFESFKYIEAGIACTILFVYPIIVALLERIFFREKISKRVMLSIFITLFGVSLLYNTKINSAFDIKGIIAVLISALVYALYIVGVKNIKIIKHIKIQKLNFYVMFFGLFVYVWNLNFCQKLQPLETPFLWMCVFSLAIIPTIISIETINKSIKIIGSVKTAILGVLEPISAMFFAMIFFNQYLSLKMLFGIFLILFGVVFALFKPAKN